MSEQVHQIGANTTDPAARAPITERVNDFDVHPEGCTWLEVDDPEETALIVADALSAELVEPGVQLQSALDRRRHAANQRAAARHALSVHERLHARAPASLHVVCDTDGLRKLASRLRMAEGVVVATTRAVTAQLQDRPATADLAVHPDTLRRAAAEVLAARAEVAERQAEVARSRDEEVEGHDPWTHDPWPEHEHQIDLSAAEQFGAAGDEEAQRRLAGRRWGRRAADDDAGPKVASPDAADDDEIGLGFPAVFVVVSLIAAVVLTATNAVPYGFAFVVPLVGVAWAVDRRRLELADRADRREAARHLAVTSAIADLAYGGDDAAAAAHDLTAGRDGDDLAGAGSSPAATEARSALALAEARLATAEGRLRRANSDWAALVGHDTPPDNIEQVLRTRDAQYLVTDTQLRLAPAVRVAARYQRRLWAQWKVAWAVLDREPPAPDDAEAAISALERDDIHVVTVARWRDRMIISDDEHDALAKQFDAIADGRSVEQIRAAAEGPLEPMVVVDAADELEPGDLTEALRQLPDDLQVVVVS